MRVGLARGTLLGLALLGVTAAPAPGDYSAPVAAQPADGRVLASARGQVGWLDLVAPRPSLLTRLVRPDYPADVAAVAGVPFGVASVISGFQGSGHMGGDLIRVDLQSGASGALVSRQSDTESLDMPALWTDGSGILYQRSNLRAAVPVPGQAAPQYQSRVEQVHLDGSSQSVLIDDARYPSPAPDGAHLAFVRSVQNGVGIFVRALDDGTETAVVPAGQFLALAYPRFSPDGKQLAFAAISFLTPVGQTGSHEARDWLGTPTALAHGFPWEVWIANADGTSLHAVPDLVDDDPSVAWSPDGTHILVYGGWGSYIVGANGADTISLPYLAGYGAVAWLPD